MLGRFDRKIIGIERRNFGFDDDNDDTYKAIITESFDLNGAMKFWKQAERIGGYISKRVLSALLIIVFITSTFTTPTLSSAKSNYKYVKTTVNIRAKPNTNSKIVGKLYWNDKVQVIKKVNKKWYLVQYK